MSAPYEAIDARYCESKLLLVTVFKLDNLYKFKNDSVIDYNDAVEVARARGFDGEVRKVDAPELHVKPEAP
jgi:hypothetical protein